MKTAIDLFVLRERSAKFWCLLFLASLVMFGLERWNLVNSLKAKPPFAVIDQDTVYLPKIRDFEEAKDVHIAQGELVAHSLLNRHPTDWDSPKRLRRLLDRKAFEKAQRHKNGEDQEFDSKSLHQKSEIASVDVLTMKGRMAKVVVRGQLIRIGEFQGQEFSEVLAFELRLTFVHNPAMRGNGGFHTIVQDFTLETRSLNKP